MPLLDRCYFNSTTSGLSDFATGTAVTGGLLPSQAGGVNGVVYPYIAQTTDQLQWEVGLGTYSAGATANVDVANLTTATSSFGSSVTLNFPATVQAGDTLIIVVGYGSNSANFINTPTGWNARLNQVPGSGVNTPGIAVFDKTYALADGSSVVLTWQGNEVIESTCIRVSSTAIISFDKAAFATAVASNSASASTPSLSSLATSSDLVIAGVMSSNGNTMTVTIPGSLTSVTNLAPFNNYGPLAYGYAAQTSTTAPAYSFTLTAGGAGSFTQGFAVAYTVIGTASLARTTILLSSNSNSKVNFTKLPQVAISPIAGLDFNNQLPVTTTSAYTVDSGSISGIPYDTDIICNNATGVTITLPSAAVWPGRKITVRTIAAGAVTSASSNVVPAAGGAAGTAILAATAGKWASLQSDGTNWQIQLSN